jgi:hypothetical protein
MFAFDQTLIGPTEAELVCALGAAARAANRYLRERRLERTAATWRRCVRRQARQQQGRQLWTAGRGGTPAAQVGLTWWTDHLGRRHVRVTGRRLSQVSRVAARANPFNDWPLWHLYPERLVLCERGGRKELLAVCGCGAAGPPEALAWMGERCGPCHDRREEGGPAPAERPAALRGPSGADLRIAFAPDGRELAGVGSDGKVRLWDCGTGAERPLPGLPSLPFGHVTAFAFAPDGKAVAVGWSTGLVLLLDRHGRGPRRLKGAIGHVHCLAYSPDGRYLAVGGVALRLFDLAAPDGAAVEPLPGRGANRLAFAPDGRHLFVADHTGALFRVPVPGGPEVMLEAHLPLPEEAPGVYYPASVALACSPDGRYVAAAATNGVQRRFHVHEPDTGRARALQPQPFGPTRALAFAPDGRTLAWAGLGPGDVRLWDAPSGALRAVLTCGAGALGTRSLAFSPDGATLAAAGADGAVRLLPWRRLLGEG